MKVHVLPGDSLVEEFRKTDIEGEIVVCREALIAGPVDADTPFEFWEQRAKFILTEYDEDEIEYHERVADELEKLGEIPADAEVDLWFEYELFCSVNMWFCLSLLAETEATIYRVQPSVLSKEDRWKGFGSLNENDLQKCFDARIKFTADDIRLGAGLWDAYRKNDHGQLLQLAEIESDCFPYLKEVCQAEIEKNVKPVEILAEITADGITEFYDVFPEFSRRAGVYGFGDLQVRGLMQEI